MSNYNLKLKTLITTSFCKGVTKTIKKFLDSCLLAGRTQSKSAEADEVI